ncbi:MAG: DUF917 domain-containing protein [Candidatus Bathyarchaeia archaeon]
MKTLNEDEVEYLVYGATTLGTGGGGNPKKGLKLLIEDMRKGRRLRIADLNELSDNDIIVCPYFCGTIAPTTQKHENIVYSDPIVESFKKIEKTLGEKISAVATTELGGFNTAAALHVASVMDIPLVDGDYVGRAAPELLQSTANIFGIPLLPSVITTETGNLVIIEKCANLDEYERIARTVSLTSGSAAVVDTPIKGNLAKKVLIKGSVSKCIEIGETVKKANAVGRNPILELIKSLGGVLVFKGSVKNYSWNDTGGFLYGEAIYEGVDEWKKHELKIWIKNENIIAWVDGEVAVTAPDLIVVVNEKGYGITNTELKEGMKAFVIGVKAPNVWTTKKGLELFGPRHFGFEFDYKPLEIGECKCFETRLK